MHKINEFNFEIALKNSNKPETRINGKNMKINLKNFYHPNFHLQEHIFKAPNSRFTLI